MKSPINGMLLVAVLSVISPLMICSVDPQSGGSSTDVDCVIAGVVYLPEGREPARNVPVVIRSREYLHDVAGLGKRKADEAFFVCSTRTDDTGYYRFTTADSIPRGTFTIEARDNRNNCILIGNVAEDSTRYYVSGDATLTHYFNDTLKPPAAIRGTIQPPGDSTDIAVRIFGLDVYSTVDGDGGFLLDNLPQGRLRVQFAVIREGASYDTLPVMTHPGETAEIDTPLSLLYRVTYNGNGNTVGTVPVDKRQYVKGERVTVPGNTGNLEKSGFAFVGWNTRTDSDGVVYLPGDTFVTNGADILLYAHWVTKRYALTVAGSGNGAVSGSDSVEHGSAHTIIATPDAGSVFIVWRVKSGSATIADSTAASTAVTLQNGDATIEGVFGAGDVITFQKTFDNDYNNFGRFVQQTGDGGYIITGFIQFADARGSDVYLIKTNVHGDTLWSRTFGGAGEDMGFCVRQTSDNGFLVAGQTESYGAGGTDVYLIKTDTDGNPLWTRTYGGTENECGYSVEQTGDDGYIIAGVTESFGAGNSDIYLIKTTVNGDTVWTGTFGTADLDLGYSVQQTTDGGYIVTGDSSGSLYLLKTDATGNKIWTRTFAFGGGYSVEQTADGGYIITGVGFSGSLPEPQSAPCLIKTDTDGNEVWAKIFTDIGNSYSVQQTTDGGFIVSGVTSSAATAADVYLLKADANGNKVWSRNLGGSSIEFDGGKNVQQTSDGGYIITGSTMRLESDGGNGSSDILLIKTDANGNVK